MKKRISVFCVMFSICAYLCACGKEEEVIFSSGQVQEDTYEQERNSQEIREIVVHVCGAVEVSGVYTLPEDARVVDAIALAGGMTEQAATEYLNLAAFLQDGEKIYVPTGEEVFLWELQKEEQSLVNINTADIDKLCTLPGVGESKAKDIINYREKQGAFEKKEDIMKVPGIKEYLFQKIKDYITVE